MVLEEDIIDFIKYQISRIDELTGNDVTDYLYDVYDDAKDDWTYPGGIDYEAVLAEIENAACRYLDFIKDNYPEDYYG